MSVLASDVKLVLIYIFLMILILFGLISLLFKAIWTRIYSVILFSAFSVFLIYVIINNLVDLVNKYSYNNARLIINIFSVGYPSLYLIFAIINIILMIKSKKLKRIFKRK